MREIKALVFDVFGTVVDWRGTIVREGARLNAAKDWTVDWGAFADDWRAGYGPSMHRVRTGDLPWTKLDALHRLTLNRLLEKHQLHLSEAETTHLNLVWHRLDPWPDSVPGLTRIKARYPIATLSNGNVSLLADMARHAKLPWDVILSAEMARRYKPDAEVYQMAAEFFSAAPGEILMVAAHRDDLFAAHKAGLRTAYVPRPAEHGPGKPPTDLTPDPRLEIHAADFLDLAAKLP
jgi:2-haloacid dehalogenase